MQATMDNRGVPATIRPVPQARGLSRGWQVSAGVVVIPSQPASIAEASRATDNATDNKTRAYDDDGLSAFMSVRPHLLGIAYRMLGNTAEAEDIAQDVWVRWQTVDRSQVRDAAAFLVTTATRLAINVMQSARSRRETHEGLSLPEPADTSADPGLGAERSEALKLGVLILLEKLSPTERAAYVLREAFDYTYRDIANVLRLEEANARQVVTRARQHVVNGRRRRANSTALRRFLDSFIAAAQRGDVSGLKGLLASDIVFTSTCGCRKLWPHHCARTSQRINVSGQCRQQRPSRTDITMSQP